MREGSPIEAKTKRQIERQFESFKGVCRGILFYPRKAWKEHFPHRPANTAVMALLIALFTLGALSLFFRHVWSPVVLPWEGTVRAMDMRRTRSGDADLPSYILLVERPDGRKTEHDVPAAFYAAVKMNDTVVKPFLYSRVMRGGAGREPAIQLRDLFILAVSILLFLLTACGGSSFIAVLYVSLFLHDPRRNKKKR